MSRKGSSTDQAELLFRLESGLQLQTPVDGEQRLRDLAAAAAALYALRSQPEPVTNRILSGWHLRSHNLPRWRIGEVLYGQADRKP
jgi:hypothetical protein